MDVLIIEGDQVTPSVNFNAETGVLVMKGVGIPEDVREMFSPITDWIKQYHEKPAKNTKLIFYFEYLNTAASKMVFDIGYSISQIHARDECDVKIIWQYERGDLEMFELGEELLDEFICFTEIQAIEEQ